MSITYKQKLFLAKHHIQHDNLKFISYDKTATVYELPNSQGSMVCYDVFPGIQLCFSKLKTTEPLPRQNKNLKIMEINYCLHGRHECEFDDYTSSFMGEGDLCINMFHHAPRDSRLPFGHYEGVAIYIDTELDGGSLRNFYDDIEIDLNKLVQKFSLQKENFYLPVHPFIKHLFSGLYQVDPQLKLEYFKLKVLELLLFLKSDRVLENRTEQRYYPRATVEAVKAIKEQITKNYRKHTPMEKLAADHSISLTALKSCFRDIYGKPLYTYLKQYRIQLAADLLRNTTYSIALISDKAGYESASKFALAFKTIKGCSPSDYRKNCKPFGL